MDRVLIIGCGDIAMRVASLIGKRYRLYGLVRNPSRHQALRDAGIIPLPGDLDDACSLHRLAGLAHIVLHFAPPGNSGSIDQRTRNLLASLSRGLLPRRLIYISTSGVYGDREGDQVTETDQIQPQSMRARRRVDAETQIRNWVKRNKVHASILRVPGIYAADRLPLDRLISGTPAIVADEDSYTNHIHADDLAAVVVQGLRHAGLNRIYNACDDSYLKMGAYFDAVAGAFDLYMLDRVKEWEEQGIRFTPVVSDVPWSGRNGFVHKAVLEDYEDLSGYQVYACGAPVVVEAAHRDYTTLRNLPETEFFSDAFTFVPKN
jgi:nucleoside-diphosphate-sugar epimerase